MKGPVPSQEQLKNNGREQLSRDLSRTLAWEAIGRGVTQRSYSPRAVRFLLRGNPPPLSAMVGCSSLKRSRIGPAFKQRRRSWVDAGEAIDSIRELRQSHKGPTLEEKYLEDVFDNNGFPVLDQTLFYYVSVIYSEDYTRVEPEIRDTLILPRLFSGDCGRIPGDGIEQGGCRQGRSPIQNLGSLGRTPVHRWNRHG